MVISKLLLYELRKIPFIFLLFSLLLVFIFKGVVAIAYYNHYDKEWRQTYCKYLATMTEHEIKNTQKNLNDTQKKLNEARTEFNEYSVEVEAIDTLLEQLKARKYYEIVQKAAQKESGAIFNMPSDLNTLRPAYVTYDLPEIIDVLGYRLLLKLNGMNFIPMIIILVFSSIFSMESETGMKTIIRATGTGWGKIFISKLVLTIGIGILAFSLFYLYDLILTCGISGFGSISNPYRSVISTVLTNDSIGGFIIKYYIIGILYTVFISLIVLLFSALSNNSKLAYAINGLAYIAFTIIETSTGTLGKSAILMTGNFMKLYAETSLIVVSNGSVIIELYMIILVVYLIAIPFLVSALWRTS